jgi:hypothetical protein
LSLPRASAGCAAVASDRPTVQAWCVVHTLSVATLAAPVGASEQVAGCGREAGSRQPREAQSCRHSMRAALRERGACGKATARPARGEPGQCPSRARERDLSMRPRRPSHARLAGRGTGRPTTF